MLLLVRSASVSARGRSFLERRVLPTLHTALRSPPAPAPAPSGDRLPMGVGVEVGELGMALVAVMCSAHAALLEPLASALVEALANVPQMHPNGALCFTRLSLFLVHVHHLLVRSCWILGHSPHEVMHTSMSYHSGRLWLNV